MDARYILSRVGQAVLVLWVAYTLTFILLQALPGDGFMIKFEDPEMGLTPAQIEVIRAYYRLDDPIIIQYLNSLIGIFRGDLGYSIANAVPVTDRLALALPETLKLAGLAFALAVLIAVGIAAATQLVPLRWLRNWLLSLPSLLISIPAFWLGIVLIQIFSFQLGWISVIAPSPVQALILPVITLAIPVSAPLAQILCRSLDEISLQPFSTVVAAKGASNWWNLSRHATRHAALPALTIAGLIFAELIAGSVVTETVFGRTGIGRLTNDSVALQDAPVIQGVVIIAAAGFVLINLLVDLAYPFIDPRVRDGQRRRTRTQSIKAVAPGLTEVTS